MNFASVLAWLDDHLGREVSVNVSGHPEGRTNSGVAVRGLLGQGTGEWGVIDARGGERRAYDVGDSGGFFLIEGDFIEAELLDKALAMELHDLQLNITAI